jgi:hypothetical protein
MSPPGQHCLNGRRADPPASIQSVSRVRELATCEVTLFTERQRFLTLAESGRVMLLQRRCPSGAAADNGSGERRLETDLRLDRPALPDLESTAQPFLPPLAYGAPVWSAEQEEIVRLRELLRQSELRSRERQERAERKTMAPLIRGLSNADEDTLRSVVTAVAANPQATEALGDLASAGQLSSLIEHARQIRGLALLKAAVADPDSRAEDLHAVLLHEWWALGGRYVAAELRVAIPGLGDLDLPVRRYDNVLHVVKLRAANMPDLVVRHGRGYVVGPEVHDAVAEAMNTLRDLDRTSDIISTNLHIDCDRAFATVVIGDPRYLGQEAQDAAAQCIRSYNSHLARIEVITWDDLIGGAELVLAMSPEQPDKATEISRDTQPVL